MGNRTAGFHTPNAASIEILLIFLNINSRANPKSAPNPKVGRIARIVPRVNPAAIDFGVSLIVKTVLI